eukprot:UN22681
MCLICVNTTKITAQPGLCFNSHKVVCLRLFDAFNFNKVVFSFHCFVVFELQLFFQSIEK